MFGVTLANIVIVAAVEQGHLEDKCVYWHRHGKLLFYKDIVVHPIGTSVPSSLVVDEVPRKVRRLAKFLGSKEGGSTEQYSFGPLDEANYHDFYAGSRFALTRKKGGWDSTRHAEILAAGAIPIFENLVDAPPLVVPFVPRPLLISAEQSLFSHRAGNRHFEVAYNATVRLLLEHTRRCLTMESMAVRVLQVLGLWPVQKPLKLLHVTCGWGIHGYHDGWQGPVSIGIFVGLQLLLARVAPGSRIVDAPEITPEPNLWPPGSDDEGMSSAFWYVFDNHRSRYHEHDLRQYMYGFGFSFARRVPRSLMATKTERSSVSDDLAKRAFDAVIYGKVGPTQGCDPLPYMNEVWAAGYVPHRVALIYGGDFGLEHDIVAKHVQSHAVFGSVFIREMHTRMELFEWRPASVLPQACYVEPAWRRFFEIWNQRLKCHGCEDVDRTFQKFWPKLRRLVAEVSSRPSNAPQVDPERCWSGATLAAFLLTVRRPTAATVRGDSAKALTSLPTVAAHSKDAFSLNTSDCLVAKRQLGYFYNRGKKEQFTTKSGAMKMASLDGDLAADYVEAFSIHPREVIALVCSACTSALSRFDTVADPYCGVAENS
eukprot:TRINITY_DN23256_c0_g1_i1.p1 TRINITY_DN23256_c0_g1~~TRINITY_DN23256_c0_g1_i1.p1  ORF type:complete len:597 (+),score=72.08 TRINITY_DN23256_c0_g1_i1:164-1954(+)